MNTSRTRAKSNALPDHSRRPARARRGTPDPAHPASQAVDADDDDIRAVVALLIASVAGFPRRES